MFVGGVPAAAVLVLVLGAGYWWFVGRRSEWAAMLPFAAPLLAVVELTFVAPLLAGFILPPVAAAAAALASGLLALLASVYSFASEPFLWVDPRVLVGITQPLGTSPDLGAVFGQYATWIALASWPLAAVAMSLLARRGTRAGALLGTAAGGASSGRGIGWLSTRSPRRTPAGGADAGVCGRARSLAVPLVASLILVVLVSLLGPPLRGEEEPSHFRPEPEED